MKKGYLVVLVLIFAFLAAVGCAKVEPGYVAIKVNQYGTQRGVEDFPIRVGRVTYNLFTEDVYKFPTFLQSVVWTKDKTEGSPIDESITFNSVEGAMINADVAVSYAFVPERVPAIFVEFRQSAEAITRVYVRSQVRDTFSRFASRMKVTDIFGSKKQELLEDIKGDLNNRLGPKGFRFDMISLVGALRVDAKVEASINAVIEATQRAIEAENKVRESTAVANQAIERARGTAESAKIEAEGRAKARETESTAEAEANIRVAKSITPALIDYIKVTRWSGLLPWVTGESIPLIDMRGLGTKQENK